MKAYLAATGLKNLRAGLAAGGLSPGLQVTISGSQVGSAYGFVPTDDMLTAQGSILLDNRNKPESVKTTLVHLHEAIYTVLLSEALAFGDFGNILLFIDDEPFLWSVSNVPLHKIGTDPAAHFVGDEYYLPVVFRFPYVRNLISFDPAKTLQAVFPTFSKTTDLTIPQHTLADQAFVEQNNLFYGHGNAFLGFRKGRHWLASPLMTPLSDFGRIDGGTTKSGI